MSAPLTVAEVLNRAADLIEPEGAWTQYAMARDKSGREVYFDDPTAVCFCAAGALNRASGLDRVVRASDDERFLPLRHAIASVTGAWPLPFNDTPSRTQSEVVSALREAAALSLANEGEGK